MVCKECKELEKTRSCNCKQRFLELIDREIAEWKPYKYVNSDGEVKPANREMFALLELRKEVEKL